MIRDELLERFSTMPTDAEIVVDLGGTEEDIVSIEGARYNSEYNCITLTPHAADLQDAFAARGLTRHPDVADPGTHRC